MYLWFGGNKKETADRVSAYSSPIVPDPDGGLSRMSGITDRSVRAAFAAARSSDLEEGLMQPVSSQPLRRDAVHSIVSKNYMIVV